MHFEKSTTGFIFSCLLSLLAISPFYWWLLSDRGHKKLGNNVGEFFSIIRSKKEKDDHWYMTGTFAASDFHPFRKCFCTIVGWGGRGEKGRRRGGGREGEGEALTQELEVQMQKS